MPRVYGAGGRSLMWLQLIMVHQSIVWATRLRATCVNAGARPAAGVPRAQEARETAAWLRNEVPQTSRRAWPRLSWPLPCSRCAEGKHLPDLTGHASELPSAAPSPADLGNSLGERHLQLPGRAHGHPVFSGLRSAPSLSDGNPAITTVSGGVGVSGERIIQNKNGHMLYQAEAMAIFIA